MDCCTCQVNLVDINIVHLSSKTILINKIFVIQTIGKLSLVCYNILYNVFMFKKGWYNIMKAVVTVIGKDAVGILAKVSTKCAEYNANVIEVTQSVLQDLFAMIMLVDISKLNSDFTSMSDGLTELGEKMGVKIHTMHEDIFNCMHHI